MVENKIEHKCVICSKRENGINIFWFGWLCSDCLKDHPYYLKLIKDIYGQAKEKINFVKERWKEDTYGK